MDKKIFTKGEVVFKQGDKGDAMYEILSGSVGVYLSYGMPDEKRLTVLGTKKYLGELSVIDEQPHSATVAAEEDCELLEIIPATLEEYLRENPTTAVAIMKNLCGRLRELTTDYREACQAIAEAEPILEAAKEKKPSLLSRLKKFVLIAEDNSYDSEDGLLNDPSYGHMYGHWYY